MFALTFVALSVFAAQGVSAAFAADCSRKYSVIVGDTCDSISATNSASTYQLAALNPDVNDDCTNLLPGQELCLGATSADCAQTYTVQPGDTCDAVSTAHGLNTTVLFANNPNIDEQCSNIYIGEVLCVAGSDSSVPLPAPNQTIKKPVPTTAVPASPQATNTAKVTPPPAEAAPAPPKNTPAPQEEEEDNNNNNNNNNNDDPEPEDDEDDEDDENLPFCDEL